MQVLDNTTVATSDVSPMPLGIVGRIRATLAHKAARISGIVGSVFAVLATLLSAGTAHASTPADPLGGAGSDLTSSLLTNFTTYVIPAVVTILVAVIAFKLIVKLASRFMNRA